MSEGNQGTYSPAGAGVRQSSEQQAGGPPLIVFIGLAAIAGLALIVVIFMFAGRAEGVGRGTPEQGIKVPGAGAVGNLVGDTVGDTFRTGNFQAGAGGQNVSGTVQIIDLPVTDDTQVQVEVTGIPMGSHAWHIHGGPCADEAAPVVVAFTPTADQPGLAEPIVVNEAGQTVTASATIPASQFSRQQLEGGTFSLHIHEQPGVEHGPTLACADLQ